LPYTAQELAAMGRAVKYARSKGQEADFQPAIDAHKAFLKAVVAGADVTDHDLDFVRRHLKTLK